MSAQVYELIESGGYIEGAEAEGLNFGDFSEHDLRILDSQFSGCSMDGTVFSACHFSDVVFTGLSAPEVSFVDSGLQDVTISQSRLGGVQAFGTSWTRGRFEVSKIGFFNLRGARLNTVRFVGCAIEELDLSAATAKSVVFEDCTIEHLVLTGATCTKVDLRGARISRVTDISGLKGTIMSPEQFADLAPSFATMLGISLK